MPGSMGTPVFLDCHPSREGLIRFEWMLGSAILQPILPVSLDLSQWFI